MQDSPLVGAVSSFSRTGKLRRSKGGVHAWPAAASPSLNAVTCTLGRVFPSRAHTLVVVVDHPPAEHHTLDVAANINVEHVEHIHHHLGSRILPSLGTIAISDPCQPNVIQIMRRSASIISMPASTDGRRLGNFGNAVDFTQIRFRTPFQTRLS